MEKIQKVSLFFRILFQIAFVALPIFLIAFWIKGPHHTAPWQGLGMDFSFLPKGVEVLHTLTPMEKFYGFLISLIPNGIDMIVLYFLIKLFRLYEKAEIFSINNVRYLRNIGYALLIGELLSPIYQSLISFAMTWNNGHGHRYITITLDGTNIGIMLLALFIILISWIMAEGCKLREEQQLTI